VNVPPKFTSNAPHCSNGGPLDTVRKHSRPLPLAISHHLLHTGTPLEQRISRAGSLGEIAEKKLNGFASGTAEKSAIPTVSFSDYPHLKAAYEGYAEAAGIYGEVLGQLPPGSDEAIRVRQLLIGAHKSCIKTIYLVLDAVEKAPGAKSASLYPPWELRACEAIREIEALAGSGEIGKIPELRD